MSAQPQAKEENMTFTHPDLPYAVDALAPHMSKQTLEFHHGIHHKGYINKANAMVEGTALEGKDIEEAVVEAYKQGGSLFDNIGQIYNHNIFWQCMKPNGGGTPTGELADAINESFGDFDKFKEAFTQAGSTQFGSGWVWLVLDENGKLDVLKTPNGENPLVHGKKTLLGCDVWEHSYYLDYQNRRGDFLKSFLDNLVNWDFVAELYNKAK